MAKGRHRKPRQPVVGARTAGTVAAVAGVAAAGALAAPSAQAKVPKVWDRVAACESSGQWHINTHNHYYGGLQFGQPTWVDFGGRQYAPRADLARRKQQIAVARRVLAVQGPHAWPVCSKVAHLTKHNGGAKTSPLPTWGPYRRVVVHHPRQHRHHHAEQHQRHHNRSHEKPRVSRYEVKRGDSLSVIAERFHVAGGWQALWKYNRTNVPHPNVILVGQILQIP